MTSFPRGTYPLTSLKGRHFHRLSPQAVETFHLANCEQCNSVVRCDGLILSEPSDERLLEQGLHLFSETPPLPSVRIHVHAEHWCQACYIKWLKPLEAKDELD